jgi:hypothetical protein
MGNAEKEDIHKIIKEGINDAMKPVYYTISGIMATVLIIFVSIAWPLNSDMSQAKTDIATLKESKINSDETYRNFVTKNQYFYLQKEEHKADVQAIINPKICHDVYNELNSQMGEQLEIRYRGGRD